MKVVDSFFILLPILAIEMRQVSRILYMLPQFDKRNITRLRLETVIAPFLSPTSLDFLNPNRMYIFPFQSDKA